tara:strand:+ start:6434 stop:7183 length:750 start_codon:yes stop_codon:yes gene_type:complete
MKFNLNKKEIIEFKTDVPGLDKLAPVQPAMKHIPTWFKDMMDYIPQDISTNNMLNKNHKTSKKWLDGTVKRCPAIIDFTTEGFIIPMWADYLIQREGNTIEWSTKFTEYNLDLHLNEQIYNWKFKDDDFRHAVKFLNPWRIYTPPGYSCMFIAPHYQFEHRFTVLPGIVQTDKHHAVQFPTILNTLDDVMVERGTPFVQVIPFKRTDFNLEVGEMSEEQKYIESCEKTSLTGKFKSGYKEFVTKNIKWT